MPSSACAAGRAAGLGREIGQGQDPDQPLVAVDDGQAAHLQVGHVARDVVGVLVVVAELHLAAHDLAHRRQRPPVAADRAHGDVAVGDHADQAVVVADRQRADVDLAHGAGGFQDGLVGTGDEHFTSHGFSDAHERLLRGHGLLDDE